MLYSMTGIGSFQNFYENRLIKIEIRSLNGKQADARIRIPNRIKHREIEIRKQVIDRAIRGKLEVQVELLTDGFVENYSINKSLALAYKDSLTDLAKAFGSQEDLLPIVMRIPNVVSLQDTPIDDAEWNLIKHTVDRALDALMDYRKREGDAILVELLCRVENIQKLMKTIEGFELERAALLKSRLKKGLDAIEDQVSIDQNRFEQELIYYIEKLDITEEKVRLRSHCEYFIDILKSDQIEKGRKLGFISQEMGREINTLGSKAQFAPLQRIVIDMKDELEKIKEQALNVL